MKIYIKTKILVLCFAYAFTSCEITSFDDIQPNFVLTAENAFTDDTKVEALLNGVYLSWRNFFAAPGYLMAYGGLYTHRNGSDFDDNNLDFSDRDLFQWYQEYYEMLQKANLLINGLETSEFIDGLTDERKIEILGEVKLQRAMAHFALLKSFGQSWDLTSSLGIVVNLEPQTSVTKARNTVQETYDAILADLNFAIENAPVASDPWLMSQTTAKAVKAQVLLTLNEYADAAILAFEVMQDTNYALETNYGDIFINGHESNEFLFSPFWVYFNDAASDVIGSEFITSDAFTAMADAEVGASNDGDMATGDGFDTRYAFDNATNTLPEGRLHGKYPHSRISDEKGSGHHILRLGEIYLIYAEAKARLGSGVDTEALTAMNAIRLRAGMPEKAPATKAELIEAIRVEKVMELFMEWSQPWFDMVRYHKLGDIDIKDFRPNIINDDRLIWPIPSDALLNNNKLVQNPGYSQL